MASQITAIITILVILILNSAFDKWPALAPDGGAVGAAAPASFGTDAFLAGVCDGAPDDCFGTLLYTKIFRASEDGISVLKTLKAQ